MIAPTLHRPGTEGYRRLNLAMVLAGLAAFGLLYAPQPVLPQLAATYDVRPTAASLAVSASTGALALTVVPVVLLARRFGRVRVMLAGLVLSVLLTVVAALAPSFGLLVGVRVLTGVVLAAVVGVAMGHVGAEVHPSGLASAMGLYVAGNSLGGVSGRLVTSGVSDAAGWRWGVLALAGAAAVVTLLLWRALPPSVADDRPAGAASGAAAPPTPRRPRPEVWLVVVLPFTLMGGFVAVYNYLGFRLSAPPFSLAPGVLGLVFLAYLAGTVSSTVAGRAAGRWGRPGVLAGSVLVMLGGLALTLPDRLALVVAGLIVLTAGFFAAHATASGWAPAVAGPGRGGQASALYVAAYYAGSSVFGLALGEAWTLQGWAGVSAGVAALAGVALVAGLALARRSRGAPGPG
ncbi:MFS transporter [Nocardioides marmoraquaticus]